MRIFSFTFVVALVGCGASSDPDASKVPTTSGDAKEPAGSGDASSDPKGAVSSDANSSDPKGPNSSGPNFACRLPAAVSSDDACSKDADCAPSVPCHARACVAVSKAKPRTPDVVCTMNIDCQSADVNPCSCYEGHCALVPKNP